MSNYLISLTENPHDLDTMADSGVVEDEKFEDGEETKEEEEMDTEQGDAAKDEEQHKQV